MSAVNHSQVVAKSGGYSFTHGELARYFESVQNRENWKYAIDADVVADSERALTGLREAVIFFTGSVPSFEKLQGVTNGYRVQAAGYYVAIGA